MPDNILSYVKNFIYGFSYRRLKVDNALHIPETVEDAGNLRINQQLEVKVNGVWQTAGAGTIDPTPTQGSVNAVSSGGTKTYVDAASATLAAQDVVLQTNITAEATARQQADQSVIDALRESVPVVGDTLNKLYNLIVSQFAEVNVPNAAAKDAYNVIAGNHVFVVDDGDGKWALYKALTSGVNATYIKLTDADLFNSIMSASAIKAAYESNPDTNAFTNALRDKLNALYQPDLSGIGLNATAIQNEIAARSQADTTLLSMINAEQTQRISSDNSLNERINNISLNGTGVTWEQLQTEILDRQNADNQTILTLRDGVNADANTLQKLFNLIKAGFHEITKATIADRDTYYAANGDHVFVLDDGDGRWALYKAVTDGYNAQYVKLSDPDLLASQMSAAAIKQAYESNPDTNALTNDLLQRILASPTTTNTVTPDQLQAEVTARTNADTSFTSQLQAEISARTDADTTLYNMIVNGVSEVQVNTIADRDAYNIKAGAHVFVLDDGDGKWALYKAMTAGVNATYVKLSDPDLLGATMSASQIKAAYESNPDTNAFTNVLLAKLNAITGTNTGDQDISGIATNAQAIASEITNRQTADSTLQTNINNEAATRASEDALIRQQIANAGNAPVAATTADINTGTDTLKYTTPAALEGSKYLTQSNSKLYAATTNVGNAYAATLAPAITAYTTGMAVYLKINTVNTGAATINLNGLGAKTIVKDATTALIGGELMSGKTFLLSFDGTNFQVVNYFANTIPTVTTGEKALTITVSGVQKTYDLLDQVVAATSLTTANWSGGVVSLTGFAGQYAYDNNYRYDCVGVNQWRRTALNGDLVDLYLTDIDDSAGAKTSTQLNAAYSSAVVGQRVWGTLYLYEKKTSILWRKFPITDA